MTMKEWTRRSRVKGAIEAAKVLVIVAMALPFIWFLGSWVIWGMLWIFQNLPMPTFPD